MSNRARLPLLLGLAALVVIVAAEWVRLRTGERPLSIVWSASILTLFSTLLLRYWAINPDDFVTAIQQSNPGNISLHPQRFLNTLPLAMIIGLAATIVIYSNFYLGMGLYFLMQVCLITAYSGIVQVRPHILWQTPSLRPTAVFTLLFWVIVTPILYVGFVYGGPASLITVPYVLALTLMAAVVWLGMGYAKRPFLFRFLPALGATSFVFSDTLIGHSVFVNPAMPIIYLISPTYILAIVLLSHAVLWLRTPQRETVLHR